MLRDKKYQIMTLRLLCSILSLLMFRGDVELVAEQVDAVKQSAYDFMGELMEEETNAKD